MSYTVEQALDARSKRKKKEEEENKSKVEDALSARAKRLGQDVDENFVNSFFSDAYSFLKSASDESDNVGWANASSSYSKKKSELEGLISRYSKVRGWLTTNKGSIGDDEYNRLIKDLDDIRDNMYSVESYFSDHKDYFSQWKTEDEYKAYLAQQKEYEDKLNMDTEAANKEIGGLENDLDDYYFLNDWYKAYLTSPEILDQATLGTNLARYNELSGKYGSSDQLEALIQDKNEYLKAAEQVQSEAALAAREEGYQKKYGGMSFEALQPVITGMEDGEEKDWLSDYAHSVMTDDDYEAQINETNKRITTLENAIKLQKSYVLMGKKGIGDLTDLQSELDAAKKTLWSLTNERKYKFLEQNPDFQQKSQVNSQEKNQLYKYINDIGNTRGLYAPSVMMNGSVSPYTIYDYMEPEEVKKYNYLYNTSGKKEAEGYLDYLEYTLNQRRNGVIRENSAKFADAHPVISSAVSVPMNLASGVGAVDIALQNLFNYAYEGVTGEYRPVDYNRPSMDASVTSSTIRGTVSQKIADSTGTIQLNAQTHPFLSRLLNGKSLGDVYQLGMSMVDSAAVAGLSALGLPGGTFLLGGSAASQGILDAVANGASDGQALTMGILNGAFEALFEYVSLEKLLKGDTKNILKRFAAQAFTEGSEEFNTTLANTLADICVMAGKSDYQKSIREYVDQGYSQEAAERMVLEDIAIGMGWDFFGGAVSGGIMGSVSAPIMQSIEAKEKYGAYQGDLVRKSLEINPGNTFAQEMRGKLSGGKDLSGWQLNKLVQQNEQAMMAQDMESIRSAAAQRLTELGETGDVDTIASALAKKAAGQKLSSEERNTISLSKYGERVSNEMNAENIHSGDYSSSWTGSVDTNRINSKEYGSDLLMELAMEKILEKSYSASKKENKDNTKQAERPVRKQRTEQDKLELVKKQFAQQKSIVSNMSPERQKYLADKYEEHRSVLEQLEKGDNLVDDSGNIIGTVRGVYEEGISIIGEDGFVELIPKGTFSGDSVISFLETSDGHFEKPDGTRITSDGKTVRIDTDDTIDLNGLAQDQDGTYKIAVGDSESVSVDNVSFSDRNIGMIYETFVSLGETYGKTNKIISGMSLDNRNALIDLYDKNINKDGGEFARGAVSAFYYGYQGIELDSVSEGSPVMSLSEEQRKAAWNLGRIAAIRETNAEQSDIDTTYENAKKVLGQKGKAKKGEYQATLADDIPPTSLTPAEKEFYRFADYVAQAAQANIRIYKSNTGEHGYYNPKTDEICLNLNARNLSKQTMMAFTLGHELVHRAKKGSPAKYKAFSEFLLKQYGQNSKNLDAMVGEQLAAAKEFGISMTADEALTEVICDACQKMLLDTNAGQRLAEFGAQSKENRGFLEDLKRWITEIMDRLRNFFRGVEPDSLAAKEFAKLDDNVKQILADMFVDMTIDAGEKLSTIKTAFGNGTVVETNEQGEFTIAKSDDGSKIVYNLTTWENGGRNTLEAALSEEGFSDDDIKAALTIMDSKYDLVKKLADQFPEQNRVNRATITTDLKDGHAVLSAIVSNGEYPVNIDLLMVCKKRQAYQRVINRLCETGLIEQATLDSLAIAEINKILGKYGFETACLGCFVESRRLRIQEWAETICREWNGLVDKKVGKGNAKAFNFADERKFVKDMTNADVQALAMELDDAYENDRLHYGRTTVVKKMAKLIDEVPSLRRHLSVADLITPQGRTRLKSVSSELNSLIACRYGSNTPKIVQSFNPYNHELAIYGKVPSQYNSLREYLYAIGGARMQSFSDFIVENWFDYCQIVADLAARKLPMHTYSKEIVMIKLFGMTGIKENMSLIPDVDKSLGKEYAGLTRNANGDLELIFADKDRFKATNGKSYMQSINFADAVKIQNDPRYSANCGTIAIGISDKQIEIMLDDSRIRMVIPYHSSGMNPIFADLVGTSFYKDYTDFQNTTVDYLLDSNGNRVNLKLTKAQRDNLTAGFEFNQVLQELGDARAAAQEYKDWCADSSQHSITIDGVTYNAVLTPKFSQFADHRNYYKLLADFNCYDCITEKAAPQGDVQQIYPEEFSEILTEELAKQESSRQKQEKNRSFDKAMAEIESYLKEHTKADTVYYAQQRGIKLSKKDSKLNASDKGKLKRLQEDGVSFKVPVTQNTQYRRPAYDEWDVSAALDDALDHADARDDNMIRVGEMPHFISDMLGIMGDFYIYRNHAYENMVSEKQALKDSRPTMRKKKKIHFHNLGKQRMQEAILALENPIMAIADSTEKENPKIVMILPVEGHNNAPLYAAMSFYDDQPINGSFARRPHLVLTVSERGTESENGYDGYVDVVNEALNKGRLLSLDKEKMRAYMPVIAGLTRVGNIADSALIDNIARFKKEVNIFRDKNGIDYKLPVGEDTSNRSLLANALESTAKNDIERKKIQEYKEKIELLNSEEQKLQELNAQVKELSFAKGPRDKAKIRALRDEAVKTANRINTYDRMLLRLEASQPLQNVLEREKKAAYRKAEQKGKEALEEYRKDAIKKQQDILDRWQKSREKGIDSRNRTAMRHKIQNVVGELNQYLLKGTKDRHVPIELQKAVAEALDAVNMDTVGAEERIAKLKEELLKAKTAEQIQAISRKIERIQAMGDRMNDRLQALKDAYDKFTKSDDPLIANSHDDVISAKLDSVIETVGDTPLRDMSLSQLKDVYDMYRMVLTTIRNANKAFKAKKSESISAMGNEVMMEVERAGGKTKLRLKGTEGISNFDWNNMKPVYAFERIGSDTLTELFNNVRAGEDTWAVDVTEAREYYLEKAKKYNYDSWDFNSRYTFTSTSGMEFSLSLEQILSLYAYSKREQAAEHLRRGGIVFDETTEVTVKTKLGIPLKFNPTEATAYNISENTLADIIGKLSNDQKAFADEMQDYLSSVMGSKGNEVSLELYGIKLFNEKFYFPLKSAKQFMEKAREQQQGDTKIKNKGFSKDTVPKASNPIVLTPFMDVWADHVNEMSMYHAFVLPMEDFYRVYNFKTPVSETDAEKSVNMFLQNAYGKGATNYIDQLLKDLNGGARSDPRENTAKVLMSKFKKAAVMASLSVVIQQPSAIARAFAMIDPKYFRPTKDGMNHAQLWEELKKYAPVAVIKEMGYFDTNMGRSTNDFIKAKEYTGFKEKAKALFTDSGYRDELISKAPSLADEVTWCAIWNAVKRETVSKHHDLSPSSDEFLKLAGERFTEVVTKTQVYDSVLARSGNMRSKTAFMNMWTSFMAEPTTSINMVQDALLKAKRGDKRYAVKAIGSVCASVILNAALVSLVYAMRDDDDDETYLEKYVSRFLTETLDGLNPLTYIPFLRDVWSVMQGFDIDRADMSLVTDLVNSLQKIVKVMNTDTYGMDEDEIAEHNRKVAEAWLSAVDSISSLTGIPFRNFRRDLNGAVNLIKTLTKDAQGRQTTAGSLMDVILDDVKASTPIWGWMPGESKADKLYDAIVSGDTAYVDRLKSGYDSEESYYSALRNAVKKRYVSGDISYETAMDFLIEQCGMSEDDAYWKLDEWNSGADGDDYSKYAEFYEAVQTGNNLKAVIKRYTDNGVKPETLSSQITGYFKPIYIEMSKSERASIKGYLRNAMVYCGADDDEAMEKLQYWDFLADNPDYRDISQAEATKYYEYAEPNGISVPVYCDYCERASQCESDKDKNGNPIDGSKKKKILEVIDSLPITKKQKDALYYASGFAASSIYEAPWRR